MSRKKNLILLSLSVILSTLSFKAHAAVTTGADIYCVMRTGGNPHETSWLAAYANIKKQRPGIFKTSPRQGASIIVEQVVAAPIKYQDCIPFIGDLYVGDTPKPKDSIESLTTDPTILEYSPSQNNYKRDRYSY
tara:strand:- start:17 stop:418 length:402 start_codon:yes stop_codon:yes gene_type:complete